MSRSGLALLLLAGGLSSAGFAPLNLWPLTILGLAFLVGQVAAAPRLGAALLRSWVFGTGHFIIGLNWIATAFTYQDNMPAWIGWLAVILLSFYLALFPALAAAIAWRTSRQHPWRFILILAAAWMLGEWLRATLLTGFAWNPLGVVWLEVPWVAMAATWIGTYGLSGLVMLIAGLLWIGVQRNLRATTVGAVVVVAGLVAADRLTSAAITLDSGLPQAAHAAAQRPDPDAATPAAESAAGIPFRVVQPNIGQDQKYDPDESARNTELYARLSGSPGPVPRLLLWPEGATLRFFDIEPDARNEVAALLGRHDLLISGGPSVELDMHGNNDVYHNSVFALNSAGSILWRYDKAHLVPFGEYLPARQILSLIGLSRLVPGEGDFSFGPGPRTFPLPGFSPHGPTSVAPTGSAPDGPTASASQTPTSSVSQAPTPSASQAPTPSASQEPHSASQRPMAPALESPVASIGVQICYEIIFSGHVVDEAHRPTFLFNPSNDAWFGAWGPPQHLAQARLRAIEEGIAVIRATPNGISALISPTGQLLKTIPAHREGVIDGVVPQPRPPTLFSRLGLWASALFGALLVAIGVAVGIAVRPVGSRVSPAPAGSQ